MSTGKRVALLALAVVLGFASATVIGVAILCPTHPAWVTVGCIGLCVGSFLIGRDSTI